MIYLPQNIQKLRKGFTIIEILLSMVIVGVLVFIATQTLSSGHQSVTQDTVVQQLVSDMRQQQLLAMSGKVPLSGSLSDYSIRFEQQRYILFPGTAYDAGSSENVIVPVDAPIELASILFPSVQVSFSRNSGDVIGFSSGNNSLSVRNTQTGKSTVISINKRGAITTSP